MEFRIKQSELLRCLQRVQGFLSPKNQILSHVLFRTTKEGIEAFATDFDIGLKGSYIAAIAEPGAVALQGRRLFDIVRQLPDEDVTFRFAGPGRCEVTCGKSAFKLATIDADEFPEEPKLPMDKLISLDTEMFKDMLKKTVYAVSQNESRMTLNGIHLELFPNAVRVVATDGHRLSYVNRAVELPVKDTTAVIIARKAVMEIVKLLDEEEGALQIVRSDNRVFFKKGGLVFFTREVEGAFPNYEQVIPRKNTKEAVINIEKARQAIKRVATVADEKSRLVNFSFKKGKLEIFCEVSDVGEAHEEIEVEYKAEPLRIGLNSAYVIDTLAHVASENVIFRMEGQLDAVLVKPTDDDDYLSIIMPMRI
ncbi:MAG: DNA polymerase III subunit beta [Nitrospinae bacterium]|nr:DNA polymerase III subunit beta [Nitrospinota bacterium]